MTPKTITHACAVVPFLVTLGLGAKAADAPKPQPAQKPNIIFILADDLGIGNVGCYGADNFKTPLIDKLAERGVRFAHAYASPLCGPSRAMLLTGRNAYNTGMTGNDQGARLTPANETMIPTIMKSAGYVTAMSGKWSQMPLEPRDWGFDEYLRFDGSGKYWNTQPNFKGYTVNGKKASLGDGEYLPDKMHDFVVDFIKRNQKKPFFVYYSMSHVHGEILPTPDSAPDSKDLYADNIAYMDKLVGKLMDELDRLNLRDNTIVVFAGDNGTAAGAVARSTINGKVLSGQKGSMLEAGALVPCIISWPGHIPTNRVETNLISFTDFLPSFAEIGGAQIPAKLALDGLSFAPQLFGKSDKWPRDWVFVELGHHWYARDMGWKLDEASHLFDMQGAPFTEPKVPANTSDQNAIAARTSLHAVLNQLNPAGGYVDTNPDGSGRHANKANKPSKAEKNTKTDKNAKTDKKAKAKTEAANAAVEDPNGPDD